MIDLAAVQNLLASWWFEYDQGNFDAWPQYFTGDSVRFRSYLFVTHVVPAP